MTSKQDELGCCYNKSCPTSGKKSTIWNRVIFGVLWPPGGVTIDIIIIITVDLLFQYCVIRETSYCGTQPITDQTVSGAKLGNYMGKSDTKRSNCMAPIKSDLIEYTSWIQSWSQLSHSQTRIWGWSKPTPCSLYCAYSSVSSTKDNF